MIAWIKNRPMTLKRYPPGIQHDGFFNKHVPDYLPAYISRFNVPVEKESSDITMIGVNKVNYLIYHAGKNAIELRMALALMPEIKKPDQIIFDFDPSDDDFEKVRKAAFSLKRLLDRYKLPSFVKTS